MEPVAGTGRVTRWPAGEAEVERLISDGELEHVTANDELASRLLSQADGHLETARSVIDGDPSGAYQLAYDAARKACAATLAAQGLRATRAGGHIAIRSAAVAQFGAAHGGEALGKFDAMRRRRQQLEYPDEKSDVVGPDEVAAAIEWSEAIVGLVRTAVPHLGVW